jgi:hypothetical protein
MSIVQQVADRADLDNRRAGAADLMCRAIALGLAKGQQGEAVDIFTRRWPNAVNVERIRKLGSSRRRSRRAPAMRHGPAHSSS